MWGEVSIFFDGLKLEGREEKTQCEERMAVPISSHVTNLSPLQRVCRQLAKVNPPSLSSSFTVPLSNSLKHMR